MTATNISTSLSARLNALRWMAALTVVISHIRDLLFTEYQNVVDKGIFLKSFYFVTGFSHEAVMVFFVISGFLVGGLSTRKFFADRFDPSDFAIHRFSRIYIVLLPALAVGYALDSAGLIWFDQSQLYSHSSLYHFHIDFGSDLGWENLLGSFFMLQGIIVQCLGSNGPLWSLSYEWWYYTMFFLAVGAAMRPWGAPRRILSGLALAALACLMPAKIMGWFLVWMIGWLAAVIADRVRTPPVALAWLLFGVVLVGCRLDHAYFHISDLEHDLVRDLVLAVTCLILFCALWQQAGQQKGRHKSGEGRWSRFHEAMAGFSYTTYLTHFPFLALCVAVLHDTFGFGLRGQPVPSRLAVYAVLLLAVYLYTYAFSLLTERHTGALRHALVSRWNAIVPAGYPF